MSEKMRQSLSIDSIENKIRLEKKDINLINVYIGDKLIGSFIKDTDGFFMFFPDHTNGGGFTEILLLEIVDLLKSLNKEWRDHLDDFIKNPNKIYAEQFELKL